MIVAVKMTQKLHLIQSVKALVIFNSDSSNDSNDEFEDLDEDEEIWDTDSQSESDIDTDIGGNSARKIFGIALFSSIFQLLFRISERAMSALLLLFHGLIRYLSIVIQHPLLTELSHMLPLTMYKVRKISGNTNIGIFEYAVCPECTAIYDPSTCRNEESQLCSHIEFPNHPHLSKRKKCNAPLMKKVRIGKKSKLVPHKVYCYRSIVQTLQQFIMA